MCHYELKMGKMPEKGERCHISAQPYRHKRHKHFSLNRLISTENEI